MATYTITPTDVLNGLGTPYIAHEEIEAGEWVYVDPSDSNRAKLADDTSQAKAAVTGIALNHAYAEQPVNVLKGGTVAIGAGGPPVGQLLVISDVAGQMMDADDLTAGDYVTLVGYAKTATTMEVEIVETTLAHT